MLNPYGSSPILAMWQGFYGIQLDIIPSAALYARSSYGCVVTRQSQGVYTLQLNTGVDDATILIQLQLYGIDPTNPLFPQIVYGVGVANQQIQFTFIDSSGNTQDPPGLWNLIAFDGNDGIDESPGNP
jgi:hypothetical protein